MRPDRKLQSLNVWQQGIQQYRAAQRRGEASGAARGGWARAFLRRLLGRRATSAGGDASSKQLGPNELVAANNKGTPGGPSNAQSDLALREGMLSRRRCAGGSQSAAKRVVQAGSIDVSASRDLRFWQRGKEFSAAAKGGFDPGAGPAYLAQRRGMWTHRALARRPVVAGHVQSAAQSMRRLLRSLTTRPSREVIGPVALAAAGGKAASKAPQPIAAAAGVRRTKSFRDANFRQQGFRLMEKALRSKSQQQTKGPLSTYPAAWTPGSIATPTDAAGSSKKSK